jgi:hypothetical protein
MVRLSGLSVTMTVVMVDVLVMDADNVVSTNAEPVVVIAVSPTDDVVITVPSLVVTDSTTVTWVITAVVSTGTVNTVSVVMTVSKVVKGRVIVCVTAVGTVWPLVWGDSVVLSGCRVDSVTDGTLVGNGSTGGFPPVWMVVMIVPVVSGELPVASVVVGD